MFKNILLLLPFLLLSTEAALEAVKSVRGPRGEKKKTRDLRDGGSPKVVGGKGKSSLDVETFCGIASGFEKEFKGACKTEIQCGDLTESLIDQMCPDQDFLCDRDLFLSDYCPKAPKGGCAGCGRFVNRCCETSCCKGPGVNTEDACAIYGLSGSSKRRVRKLMDPERKLDPERRVLQTDITDPLVGPGIAAQAPAYVFNCLPLQENFCPCSDTDPVDYCEDVAGEDCVGPCMDYIYDCCNSPKCDKR
jgi:hypothetical protein